MDIKRILQAMDGVSTKPVEGGSDMSKFLSIIKTNDVSILTEGVNPHKVSLPVQMAMQHYQEVDKPRVLGKKESVLKKYVAEAEAAAEERAEEKRSYYQQYAKVIAERVMMKEGRTDEIAGAFPSPSTKAKWAADAAASNAAEAQRLAAKKAVADAERLKVNNAIVDKEQRTNYHAMPDNEVPAKEGFGDVVKGIKRKIAGKEDPEAVAQRRYMDYVSKRMTGDPHHKAGKRYDKVDQVVRKRDSLPMNDALKVLRQYGADRFQTTSNELHFYKNGKAFSVDLILNPDTTRSVTLSSLNSATRGLKGQGVSEGDVVQFPKKHKGDLDGLDDCPKCGRGLMGGTYMGHKVKVCNSCKQVYLPPNSGIDQKGNKIDEVAMRMQGSSAEEKAANAAAKQREAEEKAKHLAIVQAYVKIMAAGQPLPPKMQQSYNTMPDFRKEVDLALKNIPGQPGVVDLEQRRNYHLIPKNEQVAEDTIERRIDRQQQLITSYIERSKMTKNPTKKQHYLAMADQLSSELDGMVNDYNEHERASNEIGRHDEEPSSMWEAQSAAAKLQKAYEREQQRGEAERKRGQALLNSPQKTEKKTTPVSETGIIKPKKKTSTCRAGQVQTGMQSKDGKLVPKCSVK